MTVINYQERSYCSNSWTCGTNWHSILCLVYMEHVHQTVFNQQYIYLTAKLADLNSIFPWIMVNHHCKSPAITTGLQQNIKLVSMHFKWKMSRFLPNTKKQTQKERKENTTGHDFTGFLNNNLQRCLPIKVKYEVRRELSSWYYSSHVKYILFDKITTENIIFYNCIIFI